MRTYTKESLIQALIAIRERGWIPTRRKGNDGGVGNTLEDLLGIDENNLPLPNAAEWELKTQRKNTTSLITLFHMEPSPRAYKFVPSILLPQYGWAHQQAGEDYPENEKSFRQTINASVFSDRGFSVEVDRTNRKVLIVFNAKNVDRTRHAEWLENVESAAGLGNLAPQPYWGFDDLFHKAGTKLHNCFFVQAVTQKVTGHEHFLYEDIYMLKTLNLDNFISAIEDGNIYIDFDARTGHNHGTKFRLKRPALVNLYSEVRQY